QTLHDACGQARKKCLFVVRPFRPRGQRSSCPRCPHKDSFVVNDDESIPERERTPDPKQADRNDSGQLALSPQASICPPPLLGHHPMVTSLLDWSKVIIRLMKDGDGEGTFELGPIFTMSCHPWYSNTKKKPTEYALTTLTRSIYPSSEPPEGVPTCEPEPEVAPTQSMEEPFGKSQIHFFNSSQLFLSRACPATPRSVIIINNMPIQSPLTPPPSTPTPDLPPIAAENPIASPPVPSSSHSYHHACQEFTDLQPITMISRAINRILVEHRHLLHMIPFVDETH
ncbi:hypothetical protein O181_063179, partial [Austropuccinia psidii MF-1]|nr:hypothetical protein [Austropuccinia psidii MF-1]